MAKDRTTFTEEFVEGATPEIDLPEGAEMPAAKEKETYTMNDGSQGSRAAFIREKFLQDNMSRKDISEKFGFAYRVVYSATVNMSNTAEAATRGRTATNVAIQVTEDGKVVVTKEDGTYVNGEKIEDPASLGELKETSRNEWIRKQVDEGIGRGDVAKWLDLSYGVVYGLTKDLEGVGRAHQEFTDGDGNTYTRTEYIRKLAASGKSRGDIAKELNVPYTVVWQATKTTKSVADQFKDLVASLKKFQDKVTDPDKLEQLCAVLEEIEVIEPEKSTEEAPAEEAPQNF